MERRIHERFPLVLRVDYVDGTEFFSEWTENLSAGGLFVRTDRPYSIGDKIALRVSFPGLLDPVEVEGRVAWVRQPAPTVAGGIGVEVTNEPGRRRLAELAIQAQQPTTQNPQEPFRVLIVEDNPRVTRSYERVLNHLASVSGSVVEMTCAPNGQVALTIAEKQGADLIITDIYMPIMDGFTLIERLRERPDTRDTPVIVITAGRAGERERAHQIGASAFLQKPVQFSQVLETIVCLLAWKASAVAP